jgi:hypothetical protein
MDLERANAARMYDYHLGGSHNFAVDREAALATTAAMPWVAAAIRANRAFLRRAVRYAAACGISQYLDLGSGIPTAGNVHEIARETHPEARVVYVDNESVAAAHSRSILADDPDADVVETDLRDLDAVLTAPTTRTLLDLDRPVCLLTVAVMHFVPDTDRPAALLARYRDHLVPGSLHVLSHATADHDPDTVARASSTYRNTSNPITPRPRAEVAAMLGGLELAEPGLVDASAWRPDRASTDGEHAGYWAAVGHLPSATGP